MPTDLEMLISAYSDREYGYNNGVRSRVARAVKSPANVISALEALKQYSSDSMKTQQAIFERSRQRYAQGATRSGTLFWMSDIHFPTTRFDALHLAYLILRDVNPNWVTTANDLWDFARYGRWEKIPNPVAELWDADIGNAMKMTDLHHRAIRTYAPNADMLMVTGNHCKRIFGALRANQNGFAERNVTEFIQELTNQGVLVFGSHDKIEPVFQLGRLRFTHGVSAASNATSCATTTLEKLSDHAGQYYYTAAGHTHRSFEVAKFGVKHFNFGCLCEKSADYLVHTPDWDLGVGVLHYNEEEVEGIRIDFKEKGSALVAKYNGKTYSVPRQMERNSIIR